MGVRLPTPAEIENHLKAVEKEERRRLESELAKSPPAQVKTAPSNDEIKVEDSELAVNPVVEEQDETPKVNLYSKNKRK